MKIRKPSDAISLARFLTHPGAEVDAVIALFRFLDSLPDEFEILGPGESAVKWPEWLTRKRLLEICSPTRVMTGEARVALADFAAIAPIERKKRRVHLWEKDYQHYTERSWTNDDISRPGEGWRKVGECEIDD